MSFARPRVLAAAACGLAAALPAAAAAKAGDPAWAQCVWAAAPASADNWLAMGVPKPPLSFTDPRILLGHKLAALCNDSLGDPKRPNRAPNWKAMAAALRKARPAVGDKAADARSILLCESRAERDGQNYVFRYEVVRSGEAGEATAFEQYFTLIDGQPVQLPQDLRTVAAPGVKVERACRAIDAQGGLADG